MGMSNVTQNIERDLSHHLGEREEKVAMVHRIQQLIETLPELRERVAKLDGLITAGEMLLKERIPDWTPDRIRPVHKFKCQSPLEHGSGVRKALEVLKDATAPMTTREITDEVLTREAIFDLDRARWERFRSNIDAGLRKHHKKGLVDSDGRKPSRWWLVKGSSFEVVARPLALISTEQPQCYLD